jgi:hypothetical protein
MGLGRVVPGLQQSLETGSSPEEKFGRTVIDIMGPVAALPYMLYRSLNDTNPDQWKKWERAMPTAIRNVSKFMRYQERGAETYRGGGTQTEFDPQDIDQRLEVVFQAFGFPPTRVTQQYELSARERASQQWYMTRRSLLLEDYAYTRRNNNSEMLADVNKEIRIFNHSVPDRKLSITPQTKTRSYNERKRQAALKSKNLPPSKMYRGLYREIEAAYPQE